MKKDSLYRWCLYCSVKSPNNNKKKNFLSHKPHKKFLRKTNMCTGPGDICLWFAYCLASTIFQWSAYTSCETPIRFYLIGYEPLFLLVLILAQLVNFRHATGCYRKLFIFVMFGIAIPLSIYATIQGFIWWGNMKDVPECALSGGFMAFVNVLTVFFSLGFMTIFAIMLIVSSCQKLSDWQSQDRLMALEEAIWNSHNFWTRVFQGNQRTQRLLNPEDANNLVALPPDEREKLESRPVECSICQEDCKIGDEVVYLTKCQHHFHHGCIKEWMERSQSCPVCRADVVDTLENPGSQSQNHANRGLEDVENPVS